MARVLRFVPGFQETMKAQRVYWKLRWADEWIAVPEAWCNFAEWTCAPSVSIAELQFRYGRYLSPGMAAWAARFREYQRGRYYVKIEFDTHAVQSVDGEPLGGDTVAWYGTIEVESDDQFGPIQPGPGGEAWYANGRTHFTCYGLEQQLEFTEVMTARIRSSYGEEFAQRGGEFNEGGRPNRTSSRGENLAYLFTGLKSQIPDYWSTRDAVEYLLAHHKPRDFNGQAWLPYELSDPGEVLPDWDRPTLPMQGASVRELLNALIPRFRLMTWRLDVTDDLIRVVPFTFTDATIALEEPAGAYIQYNPNTIQIAAERDRGASVIVKRDSLNAVDQVITLGARRTSTGTFSFYDSSLAIGWDTSAEAEYESGGQSDPAFPATDVEKKIQFALNFRERSKYAHVFKRFSLPDDWDGMIGNGTDGVREVPLMPQDGFETFPAPLLATDWRFATTLAMLEGFDYSDLTAPVETSPAPHDFARPFVLLPLPLAAGETLPPPGNRSYLNIDSASLSLALETLSFPVSCRVYCGPDGCLYVDAMNGAQEWIAREDFVGISLVDQKIPNQASFREMLATLTMEWSEYTKGVYPEEGPFGIDVTRRKTIIAGESYRCDYVVAETVIGTEADGTLRRVSEPGYIRDDRKKLKGIAQLAFEWYGQTRHALDFSTSLVTSAVKVGDFVKRIGDPTIPGDVMTEEVNSVVTSIRITSELVESDAGSPADLSPPKMTIQTAFGEFDLLRMLPVNAAR